VYSSRNLLNYGVTPAALWTYFSCFLVSDSHVLGTVEVEKKGNVKINFTLEQAMRAYTGRRGMALLFL